MMCCDVCAALLVPAAGVWCVLQEVESHPFDVDTMLFMDWRDDHLADLPEVKERNSKLPTFLYAMPFTKNKVIQGTQLRASACFNLFPGLGLFCTNVACSLAPQGCSSVLCCRLGQSGK